MIGLTTLAYGPVSPIIGAVRVGPITAVPSINSNNSLLRIIFNKDSISLLYMVTHLL